MSERRGDANLAARAAGDEGAPSLTSLDLGIVGNCTISALIDRQGTVVWSCFPRFDGDPLFCRLLDDGECGFYAVELDDLAAIEQHYLPNTAVLVTRLVDRHGDGVEITDFAPRFLQFGRIFRPTTLMRIVRPFGETPRIRLRRRPMFHYGAHRPDVTGGSNHIRYVGPDVSVRLTTNAPLTYVLEETPFILEDEIVLMPGPDESPRASDRDRTRVPRAHRRLLARLDHAAVGAVRIAAGGDPSRDHAQIVLLRGDRGHRRGDDHLDSRDRRPDAQLGLPLLVRILNRLGYIETMEDFLAHIGNIVGSSEDGYLQPVYGIGLEARLIEREITNLQGLSPQSARSGGQSGLCARSARQLRLGRARDYSGVLRPASEEAFHRLETVGDQAFARYDKPDAGLWELRSRARVHTHSRVMCWAACDRLARIAGHLNLTERSTHWQARADRIRETILRKAWNARLNSFTAAFGADDMDASLLLMQDVGFVRPDGPRFVGTVAAIERQLKRGHHLFRYVRPDDFGTPENAFVGCTFWYIDALIAQVAPWKRASCSRTRLRATITWAYCRSASIQR